jgi:hypothetical protein
MPRTKGSLGKDRAIDAKKLRDVLKPIYDKLRNAGVQEESLPSNDLLVAKLLDFLDEDQIDNWVNDYARLM